VIFVQTSAIKVGQPFAVGTEPRHANVRLLWLLKLTRATFGTKSTIDSGGKWDRYFNK
jgi:hypothetical protein